MTQERFSNLTVLNSREAGDGAVVRALSSYECGPDSNPGVDSICRLSLLLVLSFAPRGFSPGTPVFPFPCIQRIQFHDSKQINHAKIMMLPPLKESVRYVKFRLLL